MGTRTAILLLVGLAPLVAGCATRGWVREVVGKQSLEVERRFGEVDTRLTSESQRVESMGARVAKVETSVEEAATSARGAMERAEAAHARGDAALAKAETAATRAEEVDARLTRLWSKRHAWKRVDSVEVTFRFARWDLDDGAQTALATVVRELKANPALTVELVGYTDPVGPREYNIQLSQRRVEAVRRFLVERGIELPRIHAVGLGPLEVQGLPNAQKRRVLVSLMVPVE